MLALVLVMVPLLVAAATTISRVCRVEPKETAK